MVDFEPIDTHVAEEFSFQLATNPSTGYSWQFEFPADRLELMEREYLHSSRLIGAGGQETIRMRARSIGDVTVVCRYVRPWEGRPVEERRILIRVRE